MAIRYDDWVKRPNEELEYNPEQILELKKCIEDPFYFLKYVKIVSLDRGEVPFEPYDYQLDLLKKFQKHRFNIALCSRQSGKALSIKTPILLSNGKFVDLEHIKVGDIIIGKNGLPTKVIFSTDIMYNHNCYEITFDNNEKIIADEDHLWKVNSSNFCKRNGKEIIKNIEKVLTTKEIFKKKKQFDNYKKKSNIYIDINDEIYMEKKNLLVDPYILGLWLGDGNKRDGRITLHIDDYYDISELVKSKNFKVSEFRPDKRKITTGNFNIYNLLPLLKKINVYKNKHIPFDYLNSSIDQRLDLLRGLMDSDGSCDKKGSCEFYQKDKNFINDFRYLLSTLGIKSRIREKKINGTIYYTVSFTTTKYIVFNLERKRLRQFFCKDHPKNKRLYIKSIKKVDSVPVKCIQVDNKDKLFVCGKSLIPTHNTTIVSIYALWFAIFHSDKTIGIVSNKESSAKMILARVKRMYESLPVWLKPGVTEYAKTATTFDNNSRLIIAATSPDAMRGEAVNLLICDEFAFVDGHKAEEFWSANYPTISSSKQSKIIVISTPNGMFNIFHRLYTQAERKKNSFIHTKISWESVPGRDKEWALEQLKNLGEQQFAQEFAVEFLGSTNTLINTVTLDTLLSGIKQPKIVDLNGKLKIYEKPKEGAQYVIGVDPAKGTGENNSVMQVLRVDSLSPVRMKQVAVFKDNNTDVYNFSEILNRLSKYYNNSLLMVENNGEGSAVIERIWWEYENEGLVNTGAKTINLGIRASRTTKPKAILLMKKLIEDGSVALYDSDTIEELASFIEENGKFFGKDKPDDCVSALYWAIYVLNMNVFDESFTFVEKKEEDDCWGILSDIEDTVENWDWSWLDKGSLID